MTVVDLSDSRDELDDGTRASVDAVTATDLVHIGDLDYDVADDSVDLDVVVGHRFDDCALDL